MSSSARSEPLGAVRDVLLSQRRRGRVRRAGAAARPRPLRSLAVCALAAGTLLVAALASVPAAKSGAFGSLSWQLLQTSPFSWVVLPMLTLLTVLAVRRWRLSVHLARPGPIAIPDLCDVTGEELPVDQLTGLFRARFTHVGLQLPGPMPATSAPTQTIDLLRAATSEKTPWAILASLADVAWPRYGYTVAATLTTRTRTPRCGVTVQVVGVPGGGSLLEVAWEDDWERAVEAAAYAAAADILPRTRQARRSPWTAWEGVRMTQELVRRYVRAERLSANGRYDEALWHYYRALREDPTNFDLRVQIGLLQEQLGLWLDALETYWAIITVDDKRGRTALRSERALYLARYRRAILLGFGEKLAEQWLTPPQDPPTKRDGEREALRERLRARVGDEPGWLESFNEHRDPRLDLDDVFATQADAPAKGQEQRLRCFFQHGAKVETAALLRDHVTAKRAVPELTGRALAVIARWAEMHLARTELTRQASAERRPAIQAIADDVTRTVGSASHTWTTHYNAACTFALAFSASRRLDFQTAGRRRSPDTEALCAAAVEQLRRAVTCADPSQLASRRQWIVSGDPDFADLRGEPAFRVFEAAYLPSAKPATTRPPNVRRVELSRHTAAIIADVARCAKEDWHARARRPPADGGSVDAHAVLAWLDGEAQLRRLVADVAVDHRHWQTRAQLINSAAAQFRHRATPAIFPDYAADPLPRSDADSAQDAVDAADRRLAQLAQSCDRQAVEDAELHARMCAYDDRLGHVPQAEVQVLCLARAALWGKLDRWMSSSPKLGVAP